MLTNILAGMYDFPLLSDRKTSLTSAKSHNEVVELEFQSYSTEIKAQVHSRTWASSVKQTVNSHMLNPGPVDGLF